jgi:hypothetical protein
MSFGISMNDLIEDIATFDGPAPETISFVDNAEDWPYMRINVGGGVYIPITKVGEYLEEVSRTLGYNFIKFDGDCRKGYCLVDMKDNLSPKHIFYIEISLIWEGIEPVGRTFLLKPKNPKKEDIREYRNKLAEGLFRRKEIII